MSQSKKPNRLINEKSPYLLQHAHNPVDWYTWSEEAFEKARSEDKPIFISIGYSTCYWCHVMEREVFENESIAQIMNDKMVNIKVDREERPDVDRIYMNALISTTGQGGWPLSAFLTPDLKPFYTATYIHPHAHQGNPGFPELVNRISDLWQNDRSKILESSDQITEHLKKNVKFGTKYRPDDFTITTAYKSFLTSYDSDNGGFGNAPKFPRPSVFNFLLRYFTRTGNGSSLKMVLNTLRSMAQGGIYDQLGGGFHRYSVDSQWHIPHFEKMLYDQAQLAITYLETYQITKDEKLLTTAKGIIDYVLVKLNHNDGGFYSAEDAEGSHDLSKPQEKTEGAFYVWTQNEIESLIGKDVADIFNYHYGVEQTGNVLHDSLKIFHGKNILYTAHTLNETAEHFGKSLAEIRDLLHNAKNQLYLDREKRPHPHFDDKIITAWNGLMISALAKAYQILENQCYLESAESTARFIITNLLNTQTNTLSRRYRDGEARFEGGLQDYAFLVNGLIDLYETTFDIEWLEHAINLTKKQIELFWDSNVGGFFDVVGNDPSLLIRTKDDYDAAEPTGNSIAALNLLKLSQTIYNKEWREMAERTISAFCYRLNKIPEALPQMLVALTWNLTPPKEIIIVGNKYADDTKAILKKIRGYFLPNHIIILIDDESREKFKTYLPFTEEMKMIDGKATVYICQNYICQWPTNDLNKIVELL